MFPSFELFGKTIGMYQVMVLCGVFVAGIYVCNISKKEGHDENDAIVFLLLVAIGIFFGGHILYGIVNYQSARYIIDDFFQSASLRQIFLDFVNLFGGSVFYGGLLGGLFVTYLYLHKKKDMRYLIDFSAPAIPLFHFFGRIGCFLGGCCFGVESTFGLTFRHSIVDIANNVNRFPVQLLEAAFNLCLFLLLNKVRSKNAKQGKVLYLYLLLYSAGRFFIEFLRGDDYRGGIWLLSTSQWISIIVFVIALSKIHIVEENYERHGK
jgi:phosphatidylglycerol:prolipoprotein diacylglycerol transferase